MKKEQMTKMTQLSNEINPVENYHPILDAMIDPSTIHRCPYCKESYYQGKFSTSTALYCPTIIRNGKVVSEDRNIHTTYCTCLNCGKDFTITNGKVDDEEVIC